MDLKEVMEPVDFNQVGFYDGEINDRKTMYAYVVLQNIR